MWNTIRSGRLSYDIAKRGLDAMRRYFKELEKGWSVSKLLKVMLVGNSEESSKINPRKARAGRLKSAPGRPHDPP